MNHRLSSFQLKKSHSLIQRKQQSTKDQHEQITHQSNPEQSHIEQLIRQKYNFTFRVKTYKPFSKPTKKLSNSNLSTFIYHKPAHLPKNSLIVNILPEIEKQQNFNISLFQNDHIKSHQQSQLKYFQKLKIKLTQRQRQQKNSVFVQNYCFIKVPEKRNLNEYKKCIKKIELNTTYRGFNTHNNSSTQSKTSGYMTNSKVKQKNEKANMTNLQNNSNISERKRIVNYMIERGFAKRMQQSLMKIRNQKRRIHNETFLLKNNKSNTSLINDCNSPLMNNCNSSFNNNQNLSLMNKPKRSVVFSISPSINSQVQSQIKVQYKKQHSIDPW